MIGSPKKNNLFYFDLIQAIKEKYEGTQVNIRIIKDIDIAKELNDMYNTEENDIYKDNNKNSIKIEIIL